MANDSVFALFDTLPRQSMPLFRAKGGTTYLYVWDDDSKKNDWVHGFSANTVWTQRQQTSLRPSIMC